MQLKDLLQLIVGAEYIRLYIGQTDMHGTDILSNTAEEILNPSVLSRQVLELGTTTDYEQHTVITVVVETKSSNN